MTQEGAVLLQTADSAVHNSIAKVLQFFGIPSSTCTTEALLSNMSANKGKGRIRLICSSSELCDLLKAEQRRFSDSRTRWQQSIHSIFVYIDRDISRLPEFARAFAGVYGEPVRTRRINTGEWIVTDQLRDFCGPMAGVRCQVKAPVEVTAFVGRSGETATPIMWGADSPLFIKIDHGNVPVFVSATSCVVDIDSKVGGRSFDVADHFPSAVPIVLYVKWAFGQSCWTAPAINACVVIDDPPLKSRYGFLQYRRLLDQMNRHGFTATIAFIPWNWSRSHRDVVHLLGENADRCSLCVHGCDHTAAEFGTADRVALLGKAREANERMSRHEMKTGLPYDRVMVFPQGVFSRAAAEVLKHNYFDAMVNTEVFSVDAGSREVRIADVWDVAVMNYADFGLFTRRYPAVELANFAFDALLGKPCLVVVHHDWCRGEGSHLVEFIGRLNALNCRLRWRPLGEVIRRSYRLKPNSPGLMDVQMYGSELHLENPCNEPLRFRIAKREAQVSRVWRVSADGRSVPWTDCGGHVVCEIGLDGEESVNVRIVYAGEHVVRSPAVASTIGYRTKTMLRRYMCEARDNYLSRVRSLS